MQANPLLSIVIPTYNRAEFLDLSLAIHINLAKEYNVQIIVSDNASTDNTEEVVRKRIKEYPLIQYFRNETNIGPDKNFERALKYPQTEYVWLLGDTSRIPEEGIDYILKLLTVNEEQYDVIVFNSGKRGSYIPQQDYTDQNKLLSDLGWHMTQISCLVYNARIIETANFERYYDTNFIQVGVIYESISKNKFVVHWARNQSIKSIKLRGVEKISWQTTTFDIWVKNWSNFVFSLPPSYDINSKFKCIMDHGDKSRLFSLKRLLKQRRLNILSYEIYKKHSHIFPLTIKYPKIFILIIALFPRIVLLNIKKISNIIKFFKKSLLATLTSYRT